MKTLETLIVENEDWLVDRVVQYAVERGYSEYTSTLREAWRASICGLSGPILEAIAAADTASPREAGFGRARDSIVEFGVEQALRHRARGIQLTDFLGLLKYYRRAYLDLIYENQMPEADARRYRDYLLDFFDHVEIGLCGEWNSASNADRMRDLQTRTRTLTNEKNKYLTIFESIREPVVLLDAERRPTHLNHAAHRLFCGDVAPGASYYGALTSPLLNAQIAALLEGASEGSYDTVVETLSGPREFNVNIQKMLDISHKFDGTVIILNDVSEYKRALRRAEAADHAKSTFLAAMSHEIRTPIAGVLGLARLLRDTPLSADQSRYVDGIISSGELLAGVVGDILDFSQAEVGGRIPVPEGFDLAALIRQVLMVVDRPAAEKGLQLVTQIAPALPAKLRGDTSMIRQVLLNLSHNAVKFTDAGEITVRVAPLATETRPDGWVRFEVIDTGVGLPDGPSDWLFDAFTQHDGHGNTLKGGVGLGLAICRKIVSSLGGEIRCHANPAGGSVFQVDLPLEPAASEAEPVARRSQPVGARVLVVDDDEVNRAVATGFLEKLGHIATSVASATDAIERLHAESFDLVLSDNRMPGVSGLELMAQIRALDSGLNTGIPVVIVTASVGDVTAGTSGGTKPDGVLGKPYDTEDLSLAIHHLLPEHFVAERRDNGAPQATTDVADADLSQLRQHMSYLGPDRSQRIIQAFASSTPARLEALRNGVSKDDRQEVSAAAHALAGATGMLGLSDISKWARDIESRAETGDGLLSVEELSRLELQLLDLRARLLELSA
ncbi:hybrid sensor histidine kinase/response regulator [Aliiruegeria sabulilitoris]|uniref:hybrid sensor histidine kinase/response regulator n=1 Tax=Aliiruegeria sabulilitoris TaxID=1510458 RepID=UPI0008374F3C|nr:ATP-binding protein [Aliiruegeria sabulilitoris]NDR58899.1 response regulator [Pseudoruegeria sp. M32A2M]